MVKFVKGLMVTLMALGLLLLAYGCSSGDQANESGKDTKKPKILVGSETTYAPFEFQNEKTGEYEGFDMDLIRAIGKAEGLDVEIKSMSFDGVLGAVQSGNIDVAIGAITITQERKDKFDFSEPYFDADQSIAVNAGEKGIKGQADLEGKTIAVQIGTTGAQLAKEIKNTQVKEFNSITDAFMELRNGGVDAVVNDIPVTADYLQKNGDGLKLAGVVKTGEQYGIGVTKGNTELLNKLNNGLKTLKENGEYDKIYQKWFGSEKQ